ncbi:MAG: flagellar hook-basal body complex protein FliE [Serpentinimonas sp.]|nr:flagellar hook-basal body complex protein FliE [Serpentinimonas sp.]MDO9612805.1 flagellar hook-basal body complex protein FliE [Serpentinimonas sp.]
MPARAPALESGGAVEAAGAAGFGQSFKTALQNVSAAQNQATQLQTEFQIGNPNVSLEQTMLAMQKAQIGFQAALHVRNRMMQAYTDVMNMQV